MHTDEYGISLSRELAVCRNTIQRIKKTLQLLEKKHNKTTELFIKELQSGKLKDHPEFKDDYNAWRSSYDSLGKWEKLEKEYQEVYREMKR
jgi:hypothetical protein